MTAAADAFPLSSRFLERAVLGRGSMGTVFHAYDRESECEVALKVLSDEGGAALLRLKDEFRSLRDVVHPNLVELYDLFAGDARCFFTMELLSGAPLLDPARPHRRRDVDATVDLLFQVADALAVIHAAGKLHRDIKPSNIVVTDAGRAVLLDFGLATSWRRSDFGAPNGDPRPPRRRAELVGTLAYMAPEQMWGGEPSPPSDWYSLGVVLYEALTGTRPFSDEVAVMLHQKQASMAAWREVLRAVPGNLGELTVALLDPDAARRPKAGDILERLRAHVDREGIGRGVAPADESDDRADSLFVGRDLELGCLQRAFDLVRDSGRPACVCIGGPSGIGKSTLVRAFVDRLLAGASPPLILAGRCHLQESVPFNALDGVVDDLARCALDGAVTIDRQLDPAARAALVRLFPVLGQALGTPETATEAGFEDGALRERAATALRDVLDRQSRENPVVVWIDDLQWGDADSAALLRTLLAGSTARVLWIFVHRAGHDGGGESHDPSDNDGRGHAPAPDTSHLEDEAACLKAVMETRPRDSRSVDLACGPLAEQDGRRLATLLAASVSRGAERPITAPELSALTAQAGGSPFIIQELVQQAARGGAELAAAGAHAAPTLQTGEDLVDRLILQRVRALLPREQRIMTVVASSSQPLPSGVVLRAAGVREPSRLELIRLSRCRLITRREIRGRAVIDTYHRRLSESIASSVGAADRRRVHQRIALALEQEAERDPELLSHEWLEAGDRTRAGEYAVEAAERADAALAFVRAAGLYRRAADLLGPTSARRADLRRHEADALVRAGRGGQAAPLYVDLAREQLTRAPGEKASSLHVTDPDGDNVDAITLRQRAVEQYLISGRIEEGLAELRVVLDALGLSFPATAVKAQLALAANLARLLAVCRRSAPAKLLGLADARPSPAVRLTIDVCQGAAKGLAAVDPMRGAAFATLGLRLALRSGDRARIADGLLLVGGGLLAPMGGWMGDWGVRMIAAARALADQLGDRRLCGSAAVVLGQARIFAGRWQQAREALETGLAILEEGCAAVAWELNLGHMGAVRALEELGDTRACSRMTAVLAKDAETRGDRYARVTAQLYRGMDLLASDDPEAARRCASAVMEGWSSASFSVQHLYSLRLNALAELYAGQIAAAAERVEAAWSTIRRSLLLRVAITRIDALALRARILLSLATAAAGGERRRLLRQCRRLRRRLQRESRTDAKAHARMLWAGELTVATGDADQQSAGERRKIVDALEAAAAAYESMGMTLWAEYARCRLAEAAGDQAARADALRALSARGIRVPDRWLAVWAPGIWTRR